MGDKLLGVVLGWFVMPIFALFGALIMFVEYAENHEWYEIIGATLLFGGVAIVFGLFYLFSQIGAQHHSYNRSHSSHSTQATPNIVAGAHTTPYNNVLTIDRSKGNRTILTTSPPTRHRFTTRANPDHWKN